MKSTTADKRNWQIADKQLPPTSSYCTFIYTSPLLPQQILQNSRMYITLHSSFSLLPHPSSLLLSPSSLIPPPFFISPISSLLLIMLPPPLTMFLQDNNILQTIFDHYVWTKSIHDINHVDILAPIYWQALDISFGKISIS